MWNIILSDLSLKCQRSGLVMIKTDDFSIRTARQMRSAGPASRSARPDGGSSLCDFRDSSRDVQITLHVLHKHMHTHDMTWHDMTWHDITLHYITMHYNAMHYKALQYMTLHYITLHSIALQYSTVQYSTVQYTTTHCNAYIFRCL